MPGKKAGKNRTKLKKTAATKVRPVKKTGKKELAMKAAPKSIHRIGFVR
jgi:hypothetical protein